MISKGIQWTDIHTRCSHILMLNISETPSTYSSPENSSGGSEVERTSSGVGVHPLLDELSILNLVSRHCKETHIMNCQINQRTKQRFASLDLQEPEIRRASVRTTTTFLPKRSCLATTEASLPKRWPLPSITIVSDMIKVRMI